MKWSLSLRRLLRKAGQLILSTSLILMLLVMAAGCGAAGAEPSKPEANGSDTQTAVSAFEVTPETYTDRAITIRYPQISKMNDAEKQGRLNQLLKSEALAVLQDYDADDLEMLTVKLDYVIGRQSAGLLSVRFTGSRYLKGTPYPTALFQSVNLELQAGRKLRLQEFAEINDQFVQAVLKGRMRSADKVTLEILKLDPGKLLRAFAQADSAVAAENPERAYSYFTKDVMGLSFGVIHALGDHVEFELPLANLAPFIKPEKADILK